MIMTMIMIINKFVIFVIFVIFVSFDENRNSKATKDVCLILSEFSTCVSWSGCHGHCASVR